MQILIELVLPYSFSAGVLQAGIMRLCDGKDDLTVSSQVWTANYLQSISEIVQSVNLLHGGNLAEYESFSFLMVDNNLLSAIETSGYSLNSAKVNIFGSENGSKWPIWSGYVIDTSLANNLLSVNCENLSKALKTLDAPVIYGNHKKLKLEVDTTILANTLKFILNGYTSNHPKILQATSPKMTNGNHKGIALSYSSITSIKIIHDEDTFTGYASSKLKLKFESGSNSGKSYQILSSSSSYVSSHYQTTLVLGQDFDDIDLSQFDRITISENSYYFALPNNVSDVNIFDIFVNFSDSYYHLSEFDSEVKDINGIKYLEISPRYALYKEIPLTNIVYSSEDLTNNTISNTEALKIIDTDIDNNCEFAYTENGEISRGNPETVWTYHYKIYPNFSNIKSDTKLKLGMLYRGGNTLGNFVTHDFYLNTILKNGEVYPLNDSGQIDRTTPIKSYNGSPSINSCPLGNNTFPAISGTASTAVPPIFFDVNEMVELDIDPTTYSDISYFQLTLKATYQKAPVALNSIGMQRWYKIGLYSENTIDDISEIFIDTDGKCNNGVVIASNDSIAYDLLGSMGNNVPSGFKYSTDTYNHYAATTGTKTSESLEILSKEGLFVTGSLEEGNIYSKPLIVHTTDANLDISINVDFIQEINEPLKDIDLTDFINLPKITFTDSSGNEEYIEVISLDKDFPTLANINISEKNYNSVFSFSSNFLSKLSFNQTREIVYNYLRSLWDLCKESYSKNLITNQGNIDFQTIYLEDVLSTGAKDKIKTIVQLNSQRRKRIVVTLPSIYGTLFPLKLGSRVKFHHPDIMQDNSLYGFLEKVSINVFEAETKISLILDTMKLGNGDIEPF